MTGVTHNPGIQRNLLYGKKVLEAVVPGMGSD